MATRYVFHIGLHKTGTTAIQRYCATHADDLARQGIDFPILTKTEIGPKRHRLVADWFRGRRYLVPADIAAVFNANLSKADSCLISAEGLYLIRGRARIRTLSETFGPHPSAICYLREPVSHMFSFYKQQLRKNEKRSFVSFVDTHRQELSESTVMGYYAFDRNLRKWSESFDLRVRIYDARSNLQDFCACMGLPPPDMDAGDADRMNVSFSENVAALHLALNRGLSAGMLELAEWQDLKRILKEALTAPLPAAILPELPVAMVDMRPFLIDFRAANPIYAGIADSSPDQVTCFDGDNLDIGSLVNGIRALQSSVNAVRA